MAADDRRTPTSPTPTSTSGRPPRDVPPAPARRTGVVVGRGTTGAACGPSPATPTCAPGQPASRRSPAPRASASRRWTREETEARRTMMELDPPAHTGYRRLVSKPFSRREVAAYEAGVRTLARTVVDDACAGRSFDFVDRMARNSCRCGCSAPCSASPTRTAHGWSSGRRTARQHRPRVHHPPGRPRRHGRVPADAVPQPGRHRAVPLRPGAGPAPARAPDRRRDPLLLRPTLDGELLTEHEFNNFFTLLVAAGNDTTRYTMTAGLKALVERPTELGSLRDAIVAGDSDLVGSAVEEILRWGSVTMHFRRTADHRHRTRWARHRGRGQGRDLVRVGGLRRRRVPDPSTFHIRRSPNPQVRLRSAQSRTARVAAASIWRGSRCACCSRSCCRRWPRSASPVRWRGCDRTSSPASSACRSRSSGRSHTTLRPQGRAVRIRLPATRRHL